MSESPGQEPKTLDDIRFMLVLIAAILFMGAVIVILGLKDIVNLLERIVAAQEAAS